MHNNFSTTSVIAGQNLAKLVTKCGNKKGGHPLTNTSQDLHGSIFHN